jgi:DNA-binding response OmpR family regulator
MYFNGLGTAAGIIPIGDAPKRCTARVLVVAPAGPSCEAVCGLLAQQGFHIVTVEDAARADAPAATGAIDLAVVDLDVGTEPALALVSRLSPNFPVVIVSGAGVGEAEKVRGLESGADDFITRPFGSSEFATRLKVCLRPPPPAERPQAVRTYRFAGVSVNTRTLTLSSAFRAAVSLTESEFNLLQAFLDHPQTVLSREELIAGTRLHGGEVVHRSIDVLIVRLRKKIQSGTGDVAVIRTVRGKGYLFVPAVEAELRR